MTRRRLAGVTNPRASEVTVFLPPKNMKYLGPGPSAVRDVRGTPAVRVYETCTRTAIPNDALEILADLLINNYL